MQRISGFFHLSGIPYFTCMQRILFSILFVNPFLEECEKENRPDLYLLHMNEVAWDLLSSLQ